MITSMNGEQPIGAPFHVDSMTAEERVALGRKIGAWRDERNMTASALAIASGVDRKTIRTIESGDRAGQPAKLKALLEALGIAQDDDYDKFSEATQAFIFSTAPIFDQLPDALKGEAQEDVVVLLASKLQRAAASNVTRANFSVRGRQEDIDMREVASEGFDINPDPDESNY